MLNDIKIGCVSVISHKDIAKMKPKVVPLTNDFIAPM